MATTTLAAAIATPGVRCDVVCIVGRVEAPRDIVTRAGKPLKIAGLRLHDDTRQNVPVTLFERDAVAWAGEKPDNDGAGLGVGARPRLPPAPPLRAGDVILLTRVAASEFRGVVSLKPTFESVCRVLARAGRAAGPPPAGAGAALVGAPATAGRARVLVALAIAEYAYLWAGDVSPWDAPVAAPPPQRQSHHVHASALRSVEDLLAVADGAASSGRGAAVCDVRARVLRVQLAAAPPAVRSGLPHAFATAVLLLPDSPLVPVTLRVPVHPVTPSHVSQGVPGARALARQLTVAAARGGGGSAADTLTGDVVVTRCRVVYSPADDCRVLETTPDTNVVDVPPPPVPAAAVAAPESTHAGAGGRWLPEHTHGVPALQGGAGADFGRDIAVSGARPADPQPPAKRARGAVAAPPVPAAAAAATAQMLGVAGEPIPAADGAAAAAAQARPWELDDDAAAATQAGLLVDLLGAAAAATAAAAPTAAVSSVGGAAQSSAAPPRRPTAALAFAPRSVTVAARVLAVLWPEAGLFVGGGGGAAAGGTPPPPARARRLLPPGAVSQWQRQHATQVTGAPGTGVWGGLAAGDCTQGTLPPADIVTGAAPVNAAAVATGLLHVVCSLCEAELRPDALGVSRCGACAAFPPVGLHCAAAAAGGEFSVPVWAYRPAWLHLRLGGTAQRHSVCWAQLRDDDVLARLFAADVPAAHVADVLLRRQEAGGGDGFAVPAPAATTAAAATAGVAGSPGLLATRDPPPLPASPARVPIDAAIVALLRALCGGATGARQPPPALSVALTLADADERGDGDSADGGALVHFIVADARLR